MPKKFKGENSKAVEAKARKAAAQKEMLDKKQQEVEDEYWRDDDKHVMKKQQRKDNKEKKRQDQLERKKEQEKMLEEEMASLKTAKPAAPAKVTRAEIEEHRENMVAQAQAEDKLNKSISVTDMPIEENVNIQDVDGLEARNVDEAISALSVGEPALEKHPEKRMKAAFAVYEETNLPILKTQNPNMRLSQLKQMLKKDWMKAPENPMNQRAAAYNMKR